MNILEKMVAESRGFLVIGIARWHYRSVGQQDYFKAYWGQLVLLHPVVSEENADLQTLPDGPEKLAKWVAALQKMGPEGQERMAAFQKATFTAGVEGVSEAEEQCAIAKSVHDDPENAKNVAAMKAWAAEFDAAKTPEERQRAASEYERAEADVDRFVRARHICTSSCFRTYRSIKFVPRREDEKPAENLIHPDTVPPQTVTMLFSAIMAISDEGGRAGNRVTTFPSRAPDHPRRDRAAVRQKAKRDHARR